MQKESVPSTTAASTATATATATIINITMPKITYLAGAKQEVKGDFYRVQNTTLLHLGKAGGGVITERLRKLRFNMLYRHAYHSDPGLWKDTSIYLMALRDPIDRFVSNFYWSGLILCHDGPNSEFNENRKKSKMLPNNPKTKCKKKPAGDRSATLADIIHTHYHGNANLLAEALCSEDLTEREQAHSDIRQLPHAGTPIKEWLDFYYDDPDGRTPVGMVLEKGFDFYAQIDGAVEYALPYSLMQDAIALADNDNDNDNDNNKGQPRKGNDPSAYAAAASDLFRTKRDRMNARNPTHNSNRDHTSHVEIGEDYPSWIQTMHQHQIEGLSAKGACCLAKMFYKEDYDLIVPPAWRTDFDGDSDGNGDGNGDASDEVPPLARIACHGPAADECTAALTSIAKRMVNRKCDAPHPTGIIPTDYKRKNESISLKTIVPDNSLSARNSFNQVQQLLQSITMVSIILVGSLFFLYKHRRFRARYGTGAYSTSTRTPPVTPTSGQSPMAKPTPTPNRTPTRLRTCTLKIDPPVLGIP